MHDWFILKIKLLAGLIAGMLMIGILAPNDRQGFTGLATPWGYIIMGIVALAGYIIITILCSHNGGCEPPGAQPPAH